MFMMPNTQLPLVIKAYVAQVYKTQQDAAHEVVGTVINVTDYQAPKQQGVPEDNVPHRQPDGAGLHDKVLSVKTDIYMPYRLKTDRLMGYNPPQDIIKL